MLLTKKPYTETLNFFNLIEDKQITLFNFFTKELTKILKNLKPIISFENSSLSFYTDEYFFKFPTINKEKNINNKNINLSLYIPAELYDYKEKKIYNFSFFICNFPLILENNYYWINGTPKVVNQQIAFDPGFIIDEKDELYKVFLYDENNKNNLIILTESNNKQILKFSKKSVNNLDFIKKNINLIKEKFKILEYKKNQGTKKKKSIFLFSDIIKNLKITEKTRYKLNQKLNLMLPHNLLYLTELDLFYIIKILDDINKKREINIELDDLENKSIKDIKDYYLEIIRKTVQKLNNYFDEDEGENNENNIIKTYLKKIQKDTLSTIFDEIFSNSDVSLVLEQINPLAELSQQKKILNLKRQEGNKNISMNIRNIHPTMFGRLCVIDTPEGESAGLINSLTTLSLINKFGLIETPLQNTKNNQFLLNEKIKFFNINDENLENVGFSLQNTTLYSTELKKSIKTKKEFFETQNKNSNKNFLSYLQIFSVACSNIPFLEHNDGNRMLMGANMQKQAVPLLFSENALVSSGLEDIIAYSSTSVKSLSSGKIIYSDNSKIIIKSKNKKLVYFLDKIKSSFNETVINHTNNSLWCGEVVYSGQILVNGFSIKNSELALGTNLTVAYMNWEGLNFEDAIILSDRLIKNDKLTSLHIKTVIIDIEDNEEIYYFDQKSQDLIKNNNLNNYALIKKGSKIKNGDILLIKQKKDSKKNIYIDLTLIESDFDGIITNIEIQDSKTSFLTFNEIEFQQKKIKIDILQVRKIKIGDKLSGRFGNKGVISKIISESDMPFLLDGTPIDVLINPLGIPSRMNIGQIFETLLGFVGTSLNTRYQILSFDECFGSNATKILLNQKLKEQKTKIRHKYTTLNIDKNFVIDGRTGDFMDNPVLVGRSYILKLYHLVDDKITSRTLGPNSLITKQPVKGKKSGGGQRFGEMEVWALEAYGASFTLNEILNLKSDDVIIGDQLLNMLENDMIFDSVNYSQSLFLLDLDLRCLGFDLSIHSFDFAMETYKTKNPVDFYKETDLFMNATSLLNRLYDKI